MTELALALIADYGVPILACVTFLSCLALPVPSSLLMLASGGFAATGDLSLASVAAGAFGGAVVGDNTGYWVARKTGNRMSRWLAAKPARASLRNRAEAYMTRWGGASVFFSCWLVAPLGPTMNYVSGLTGFPWLRFALWGFAGEVVWVGLYVGLGYLFADNISAISDLAGNVSGLIAAFVISGLLGVWLWRASAKKPKTAA